MPIDLSLYPENWEAIALSIKAAADWTCEGCGKPCRPPGVSQQETEQWLIDNHPQWLPHLYEVVEDEEHGEVTITQWLSHLYEVVEDEEHGEVTITKPQRFTLTTAHLDHNPANCDHSNLKALCSVCHLNLDRDDWNRTRKARELKERERHGQLTLDLDFGGDE